MKIFITLLLLVLPSLVQPLYFYLDGAEQKCFIEELPKDTTVIGSYKSEEFTQEQGSSEGKYAENLKLGIQIVVEEGASKHRIVDTKGSSKGKFTFTASESGDHLICLSTNTSGWFSNSRVKLHLDLMFGDTTHPALDAGSKEALDEMTIRVRDINARVLDIRREQTYQRERERDFRDTSEKTNGRVFNWAIVQVFVLGITCVWQMRHLKNFFVSKKLV